MMGALLLALLTAPDGGAGPPSPVEIASDFGEAENKRQLLSYRGHVKAVRGTTTVTCDRLEGHLGASGKIERIHAEGNVVAVDGDRQAFGDRADYDTRTGVLVASGNPHGRMGAREVQGELVTFITGEDTLTVERPHTVSAQEKLVGAADKSAVVIDADTLTMVQSKATATWKGHVRATRGPTVITAPELDATWDASGAVTRMVARGGVDAVEPTRRAKGQRADFDVVKGIMVVTGRPEAHQGHNHMRGSRVTFFPDTDFVAVENAVTIIEPETKKTQTKKAEPKKVEAKKTEAEKK